MSGAPHVRYADGLWTAEIQPTLRAADQLLIDTAEAVGPGSSAPELLAIATSQRRHLAALAGTCRNLDASLRMRQAADASAADAPLGSSFVSVG